MREETREKVWCDKKWGRLRKKGRVLRIGWLRAVAMHVSSKKRSVRHVQMLPAHLLGRRTEESCSPSTASSFPIVIWNHEPNPPHYITHTQAISNKSLDTTTILKTDGKTDHGSTHVSNVSGYLQIGELLSPLDGIWVVRTEIEALGEALFRLSACMTEFRGFANAGGAEGWASAYSSPKARTRPCPLILLLAWPQPPN